MKNSNLKIEISPEDSENKLDLSQFSINEPNSPKQKPSFVDIPQSFSQLKKESKQARKEDDIDLLFDLWCQLNKNNKKSNK